MPIRITGMNSGLDTEAIIRELVSASSTKKEKIEKEQTKLEWKQDAWKDLNKKIKSFQSKVSNMRFSDVFRKKKTTVSNSNLASVVTGDNAVNGSQTLVVKKLATSGYLTGGKLGKTAKGSTTLNELTGLGKGETASISVKVNGKETKIDLNGSSTVDDVVSKLNSAGLNASFDKANQRFFINSTKSGSAGDFRLSANDVNGLKTLGGLGLLTKSELENSPTADKNLADAYVAGALDETAAASYIDARAASYASGLQDQAASADTLKSFFDKITALKNDWQSNPSRQSYEDAVARYTDKDGLNTAKEALAGKQKTFAEKNEYLSLTEKRDALAAGETLSDAEQTRLNELETKYQSETITRDGLDAEAEALAEEQNQITEAENAFKSHDSFLSAIQTQKDAIASAVKNAKNLNDYYAAANADKLAGITGDTYEEKLSEVEAQITARTSSDDDTTELDELKSLLTKMVGNEKVYNDPSVKGTEYDVNYDPSEGIRDRAVKSVTAEAQTAYEQVYHSASYVSDSAVRITGEDAVIELNGAEFTSSTNSFTVNGLTITANSLSNVTGTDVNGNPIYEQTQISTQDDVDGIYNMIKGFLKEYNALIKEIDGFYNAASAKDYEPLTSEEKEAMTDDEVEKWEEKIKTSILRHDSELGSVRNLLRESMMGSVNIGGKNYTLGDFGIFTQGYFEAEDDERSMLHIDGDSDDEVSSGNKDLLKKMIASDPDTVSKFFNQLTQTMYDSMSQASKSLKGVRSYGNFYSDKTLTSKYDSYKSKIKKQEDKIAAMEDKYYKMFSNMEKAMAKTNSMSSYITNMFG